jgi:hypothetical protein
MNVKRFGCVAGERCRSIESVLLPDEINQTNEMGQMNQINRLQLHTSSRQDLDDNADMVSPTKAGLQQKDT